MKTSGTNSSNRKVSTSLSTFSIFSIFFIYQVVAGFDVFVCVFFFNRRQFDQL